MTRELWVGIGIGLILSSLLMLAFNPRTVTSTIQIQHKTSVQKVEGRKITENKVTPPVQKKTNIPLQPVVSNKVNVFIPPGSTSEAIAQILKRAEVISSTKDFIQMSTAFKVENKFLAGSYQFAKGEDLSKIIQILITRPNKQG